jgi:predicted O-methyltransferase YrrM
MEDNGIIYPKTSDYLNANNTLNHTGLTDLEKRALEERRPIVQRDTALFLQQMIRFKKPKHVLEIGANFGYSALCMALASNHDMKIDTIEYLEENVHEAQKNFKQFDIQSITIHHMDAIEFLDALSEDYITDFVFIDANKADNPKYVEKIKNHMPETGIILVDNILWKGQVSGQTEIQKRYRSSTKSLKEFNEWMMNHPEFDSQILPIGDGLMMSVKR